MHTVASMESVYVFIHVEKTIASLCERRDGLKNLRIALLIAILIQRLLVYAVWVASWTPWIVVLLLMRLSQHTKLLPTDPAHSRLWLSEKTWCIVIGRQKCCLVVLFVHRLVLDAQLLSSRCCEQSIFVVFQISHRLPLSNTSKHFLLQPIFIVTDYWSTLVSLQPMDRGFCSRPKANCLAVSYWDKVFLWTDACQSSLHGRPHLILDWLFKWLVIIWKQIDL